jgi:hypothetical protein
MRKSRAPTSNVSERATCTAAKACRSRLARGGPVRIPRPSAPVTDSRTASSAGTTPARARDDRQTRDRENDAPVDRDLDSADARQREIGEEPAEASCDADAGKSAEKSQQNALDQAELEQPARARAERFSNRHVASRCQPSEDQQVRDIGHS